LDRWEPLLEPVSAPALAITTTRRNNMADEVKAKTEEEGSSAATAIAVGVGAIAAVTLAPVLLPVVGLGAVAAAVGVPVLAGIGGLAGYFGFGKK
jgi:hypothetical protein